MKNRKSIVGKGSRRASGKRAQKSNISAAIQVADSIRSTLGPKGMDKMLVDSYGDIIITNDGVTILKEMAIEHPAAKMVIEVAQSQESEVGDGTTTAVIIAGELLKRADELLDKGIHPTKIIKGYRRAASMSDIILDNLSEDMKKDGCGMLECIASTAMTGKGAEIAKDRLAELCVKAIKKVGGIKQDIKIEKVIGESVSKSELIQGVVIGREKVNADMPKRIKNAKVALIDASIELKATETKSNIRITSPEQMDKFVSQEEGMIKEMIAKIKKSGANVVFCQKGIDDFAHHFLAKEGIYACRRVMQSDMRRLAKATNARIVNDIDDLGKKDLGKAGMVEEKRVGEDYHTFVSKCDNAKSVTLLIKGNTEHIVDEVERAIEDAIGDIATALKEYKIVGGAGSTEMEVAKNISTFASGLDDMERRVFEAFAGAIESIPRTLALNAGLDDMKVLHELKKKHSLGEKWSGVDVFGGKIINSWDSGVIEPLKIKTQAIDSATEVANMILRIDDVLLSGPSKKQDNKHLM